MIYRTKAAQFEMPTQFFIGDRSTLTLTPVSGDPEYWDSDHLTRALVTLDWNDDGRVDFATTDLKEPLALLENRSETKHHWLQLQLVGRTCERDAIGAVLALHLEGGRKITRIIQTGDGYMCKNQSVVFVGLGETDRIERLEIRWPDGQPQTIAGLASNQRWLLVQGDRPFSLSETP